MSRIGEVAFAGKIHEIASFPADIYNYNSQNIVR